MPTTMTAIRLDYIGAAPAPHIVGVEALPGTANYFIGRDPHDWHTHIPTYAAVAYHALYPGIDLVYYSHQGQLEDDWRVSPGADPGAIQLAVAGAAGLRVDDHGNLLLDTAAGTLMQHAPLVYQQLNGRRQAIAARYMLTGPDRVGFIVGAYDTSRPLVIDPTWTYSTVLGGANGNNHGYGVAVDQSGNAYIVGTTPSTTFPTTTGAYSTTYAGGNNDAFAAEMSADGSHWLYSTYIGGTDDDQAYGVAVDRFGNAYITGLTRSADFPMTPGAYQAPTPTYGSAFVTKLSADGTHLIYSTQVGGSEGEWGYGIAVDGSGAAYVTGWTSSSDFPTTAGAYQSTLPSAQPGGVQSAFVFKMSADGHALVYSTYLAGIGNSQGDAIALDSHYDAYVTGWATDNTFPTTTGAYSNTYAGGNYDAFVTELNPDGSGLVYSTYLGGSGDDQGNGIAVDSSGAAYVTGSTTSSDFPTQTPYQGYQGNTDAFVTKVNPGGSSLVYSTYLGGTQDLDVGTAISVDGAGDAYVTGYTNSGDFPTVSAVQSVNYSSPSAFITAVAPGGNSLLYSTYLGGTTGSSFGWGIAVDCGGNTYVTGDTGATDFPQVTTPMTTFVGGSTNSTEAFLTKLGTAPLTPTTPQPGILPYHAHYNLRLSATLNLAVDLSDGHLDVSADTMNVPARGPDLALHHVWDSVLGEAGSTSAAGQGWFTNLLPSLSGSLTGTLTYTDSAGVAWPFVYTGSPSAPGPYSTYRVPGGLPWQLTASSAGYTLTNQLSGETLAFNAQGQYTSDTDAYGNANTLAYGANGPTALTNSGGRQLGFSYSNGFLSEAKSNAWITSGGTSGQHATYGYSGNLLTTMTWGAGTSDSIYASFGYSGTQLITVTTPARQSWQFRYDAQGRLSTITSPVSGTTGQAGYTPAYTTLFTYNPGQTIVVEGRGHTAAITTTYTLDSQGEAIATADGLNDTSTATYDADHNVLTSQDANGNVTVSQYQYVGPSANIGLLTETDSAPVSLFSPQYVANPLVTRYSYDGNNNLIETDKPAGGIVRYAYDGGHSVITTTELLGYAGSSCQGTQSMARRILRPIVRPIIRPSGLPQCSYIWRANVNTYDQYGERVSSIDGRGLDVSTDSAATVSLDPAAALYTRTYTYNTAGDLSSESTPPITTSLGGHLTVSTPVTTTYGYDGDGNQTSVTSANGNTTTYSYDHLGRQTQVTEPAVQIYTGSTITPTETTGYDRDGNVVKQVDGNGDVTLSSVDPMNRLTAQTTPISGTTLYTYTATRQSAIQDPQGHVTSMSYDAAGRLLSTTDAQHDVTQDQYDPAGNTTVITTGNGTTATSIDTRQYDALNRVVTETVGLPGNTQQTVTSYDADGNVYQVQQPNDDVTIESYDLANQHTGTGIYPTAQTGPTGTGPLSESSTYDAAGNVSGHDDFDNRVHNASYDGDNRLVQSLDVSTAPTGTTTITTTPLFDPDGNVISQTTQTADATSPGVVQTSTETDSYNAADWLHSSTSDGVTTTYDYDGAGQQRSQTVLGNASHVRDTLSAEGLVTQTVEAIGGSTPYTDTFGYSADDLPLTQSVPGTVTDNIGYDGANRLTTTSWNGPTGVTAPLSSTYGYGYNAASWTTALTSTLNGVTTTQTITHDAQGRLTATSSGGSGGTSQSWSYDGNGNLLTSVITTTGGTTTTSDSYASAQPNELLQLTTSGQPTLYYGYDQNGDTTSITNGAAISTSLQYDSQARPITITLADGTQVSLGYNDAGQRSSYRVSKGGSNSLAEAFQYRDGLLGQAVVTTTSTYTDTYLYTQSGAPLELVRKQANGSIARYWYVVDGQDSVVALTDGSGKVVDRYSYDLWGNPTSVSESVPQQLRYAGYWWDAQLGWYWVSVRYYDPALERWVQPDPSQIEGVHTYAYVSDDPVDETDPTGNDPGAGASIPIVVLPVPSFAAVSAAAAAAAPYVAGGAVVVAGVYVFVGGAIWVLTDSTPIPYYSPQSYCNATTGIQATCPTSDSQTIGLAPQPPVVMMSKSRGRGGTKNVRQTGIPQEAEEVVSKWRDEEYIKTGTLPTSEQIEAKRQQVINDLIKEKATKPTTEQKGRGKRNRNKRQEQH